MDRKITLLSVTYLMFVALLLTSGSIGGALSEVVYYLAFLLPLAFALFISRGDGIPPESYLKIDKNGITVTLFSDFPTVFIVLSISIATSFVMERILGAENTVDVGSSFGLAILLHALLPAILEELLFRYLPMRLLSRYSRIGCIFVSAFFFSLVHHNLFSIPYAFVAGVIFMAIDLVCDSVIPSLIIHFINNVISLIFIFNSDNRLFKPICISVIALLAILSLVVLLACRMEYVKRLKSVFVRGEKPAFNISMLAFGAVCLFFAIINLM